MRGAGESIKQPTYASYSTTNTPINERKNKTEKQGVEIIHRARLQSTEIPPHKNENRFHSSINERRHFVSRQLTAIFSIHTKFVKGQENITANFPFFPPFNRMSPINKAMNVEPMILYCKLHVYQKMKIFATDSRETSKRLRDRKASLSADG
jgi:hypothetical protein